MPKEKVGFALFDRSHTGVIKGISILIIMITHFCNGYTESPYFSAFAGVGVCLFLICSGYGINESYKKNGFDHYFSNKILKVYIPSEIIFLIFILINRTFDIRTILKGVLFLDVKYGWYLQFLFILYFLYFLSRKLLKDRSKYFWMLIPVLFIFIKETMWAEQAAAFSIGMIFSEYNIKALYEQLTKLKKIFLCLIFVVMIAVSFLMRHIGGFYVLYNAVWMVFKTAFAMVIILAAYYFQSQFITKVFMFIGSISFALYLVHGYLFDLCLKSYTNLKAIFVLSYMFTLIMNSVQKYVKGKRKYVKN